jgi:hypothetical protein
MINNIKKFALLYYHMCLDVIRDMRGAVSGICKVMPLVGYAWCR